MSNWFSANWQWLFGSACTLVGGGFALFKFKWTISDNKRRKGGTAIQGVDVVGGTGDNALIGEGASVSGILTVGSNNVQNITVAAPVGSAQIPTTNRRPSSPTGNDIRIKEENILKELPLVLREETRNKFLDTFVGVRVEWPISIYEIISLESPLRRPIAPGEDDLMIHARYGDKIWGAWIRLYVRSEDYPDLKTVTGSHHAFLEGKIRRIEHMYIIVDVSNLSL